MPALLEPSGRSTWPYPAIGLLIALSLAAAAIHAMFARALYAFQAPFFFGLLLASACACGFSLQIVRLLLPPLQRVHFGAWIPLVVLTSLFGGCLSTRCTSDALFDYELRLTDRSMKPVIDQLSRGNSNILPALPSPAPSGLQIYQGADGFVVAVTSGSVNIDDSTLIFDSGSRRWRRKSGDGLDEETEKRKAEWKRLYPPPPPP